MSSWKDKFNKILDKWSEPIDGFRNDADSGRGEPLFKKGDKVITWDNEKATVTRKMEYGDGWAYDLKLDSGKLVRAMKQKDLKLLEETKQMKITTKELRKIVREELEVSHKRKINENPNSAWYKRDAAKAAVLDWIESELELADDPDNKLGIPGHAMDELKRLVVRHFKK